MSNIDQRDNLTSFRHYYEANMSAMILFAKRFVSLDTAEDIVHDVFIEMWNYLETHKKLPLRSYAFMAVRNRCLNILKREQAKENYINTAELDNRILGLDYYDSTEKLLIDAESLQEIYEQIDRLPEKCRVIFKMSYFEEKRNAEIAELLNISIRTVEHQLYLGLKTLRASLVGERTKKIFFLLFF